MTMKKLNVKSAKISSQACHNECIPQGESETTTQQLGRPCHTKQKQQQHCGCCCLQQGAAATFCQGLGGCLQQGAAATFCLGLQQGVAAKVCQGLQQGAAATFCQGLQTAGYCPALIMNDNQAHACQTGHADSIKIPREANPRKKEKSGFFRSLRRRLSSFLSARRKSDCGVGHSSDRQIQCSHGHLRDCQSQCSVPNLTCSCLTDKIGLSHSIDRRTGSQSYDSLSCPLKAYLSPKFSEWHSNRNHCNLEASKEKSCCLSKDISQFSPTSSLQCDDSVLEEATARVADLTINMKDDKTCHTDFVCELAKDCVEFDPAKEKMKIWRPKVWNLTQELLQLSKFGWYWGPISRNEAEEKLTNQPDGAFLVRDSSDLRYLLSLSFRSYGCTFHTRIEIYNGMFSFYSQPYIEGYPSIVELIEQSVNNSGSGIFYFTQSLGTGSQQFPVRLTKPISRYTQVRSLQYLCRFVIRQHTRFDRIQQLPLPSTLKSWIEESQY